MKRVDSRGLHEGVIEETGRRILSGEFARGAPLMRRWRRPATAGRSLRSLGEAMRIRKRSNERGEDGRRAKVARR
jgi:hypothetical protein